MLLEKLIHEYAENLSHGPSVLDHVINANDKGKRRSYKKDGKINFNCNY
jgi:hypothetical protein